MSPLPQLIAEHPDDHRRNENDDRRAEAREVDERRPRTDSGSGPSRFRTAPSRRQAAHRCCWTQAMRSGRRERARCGAAPARSRCWRRQPRRPSRRRASHPTRRRTSRKPSTLQARSCRTSEGQFRRQDRSKACDHERHLLSSKTVTDERHGGDRNTHEDEGRNDRARRKPREAADAVTGGAAIAHPAAEADQKARDRIQNQIR